MKIKQNDTNELIKFRNGDKDIINKLYSSITKYALSWKERYNISDDDVQDIVHNTLYALIKNLRENTGDISCSLTTYAVGFTKNMIMHFVEENSRFKRIWDDTYIEEQVPFDTQNKGELESKWRIFNKEFRALPAECQKLLELKMEQYKQKEIAALLNTESVNYIKKRSHLCMKKFMSLVENNPNFKNV